MLEGLTPNLKKEESLVPFDNQFNEIELSEEEATEALRLAREIKYYQIQREEYRKKIIADMEPKKYSAAQLHYFFKKAGLVTDDDNIYVVQQLCLYFSESDKFNGDLNKGILLMGGIGLGKSTLLEFFKKNQVLSYKVLSCREIESKYSSDGDEIVRQLSYMQPVMANSDPFGHKEIGLCFDDLGTETNGKHYGKDKNVLSEIISNRYDNQLDNRATHITTNLTAEDIKKEYGPRIADRMRQMFNIIQFPTGAKSRRV